jgi:hypothetical protein
LWKVDTLVPPPLTASAAPVGTTSAPVDAVSNGAVVASMPKVTDAQPVAAPSKAEVTASALVGKAGKLGVAASNTDSTATSVDARTSPNLQNSAELPGDSSILPNVPNSGVASKSANVANSAEVTNPVNTPDSTEASNAVNIPNTPEIQNGRVAASSPAIDRLPPDVVVLYLDDAQKASASRIGEYLQTSRDSEVTVRHFDHVTWKFSSPVELHYFHADDQPEAHRIVSDLRRNNVAVTARYMPVSDEIPENYFEVWLRPSASDANDNPPDLSPEIQGGKVLEPQTRFLK